MTDLLSLTPEELEALLVSVGEPKYRAAQMFPQLHRGVSPEQMTNIGKATRQKLDGVAAYRLPTVRRRLVSALDGTVKYLFALGDGNCVESVVMKYKYGNTICISSQVGCRMGCRFCASTIGGKVRDLTPGELVGQVIAAGADTGERISHIVLMGIGEPLDNFDTVMRFLKLINHPEGRNISMRHISLSTCGLTERFDDLAERDLQITLSVSLHAPDDETRSRIMPANRGRGVNELFRKCKDYYDKTGRRISFEYAMIDGVNDSPEQAELLARRVKPLAAHVNLIPLNHVDERSFEPSKPENLKRFVNILTKNGVNTTIRRRLGSDVDASCGQLRRKITREAK